MQGCLVTAIRQLTAELFRLARLWMNLHSKIKVNSADLKRVVEALSILPDSAEAKKANVKMDEVFKLNAIHLPAEIYSKQQQSRRNS